MSNVQFEGESVNDQNQINRTHAIEPKHGVLIKLLFKTGLVKSELEANILFGVVIIVCIATSFFYIRLNGNYNSQLVPPSEVIKMKQSLPK